MELRIWTSINLDCNSFQESSKKKKKKLREEEEKDKVIKIKFSLLFILSVCPSFVF